MTISSSTSWPSLSSSLMVYKALDGPDITSQNDRLPPFRFSTAVFSDSISSMAIAGSTLDFLFKRRRCANSALRRTKTTQTRIPMNGSTTSKGIPSLETLLMAVGDRSRDREKERKRERCDSVNLVTVILKIGIFWGVI
ncbi:hypothetical protein IHE45_10G085500 [Dioscorea alata]|uniref:Uncharacterized protein n=1 Tax=Dioscorea alata TaxID=55571 RepID=A0ACB7VCH1_DIOAL|nr:hypothetical protein IHE45_10G085500 [Dioscorea alata]